MTKEIIIGGLFEANGYSPSAWMLENAVANAPTKIEYFCDIIKKAERGKLDFFFLADTPACRTDNVEKWARGPLYMDYMEPITTLSALAMVTQHIGLGATASTSFYEPYNLARLFAALDHISHGRAAWNVVTTANDYAAKNFGLDKLPPHDLRYEHAEEFYDVVCKLWDSWEDDAFIWDKANAYQFDPKKLHVLHHDGRFFKVDGALNVARPPQGHPVIFEAGASEKGKAFAARSAEVVFGTGANKAQAIAYYQEVKSRLPQYGRSSDDLHICSGISLVVGKDKAEAQAKWDAWQAKIHTDIKLLYIKTDLETDLSDLPLDEPVPLARIPSQSNFHQIYFDEIAGLIRQGLTLREVCKRYNRSKAVFLGNAQEIADEMQDWVESGACDGFMIAFPVLPDCLDDVVEEVIPELQRRGLFKTDYRGTTLREHLGLKKPKNSYLA